MPTPNVATTSFSAEQSLRFSATGLRPATIHQFWFDAIDESSSCRPLGGVVGDDLVSGEDGVITFDFLYGSGITTPSDLSAAQGSLNRVTGNKIAAVRTSDNSSYAAMSLTVLSRTSSVSDVSSGGLYSLGVLGGSEQT